MLGPSKYIAQGKTTRKQSNAVDVNLQRMSVPRTIQKYYSEVVLDADIMHLNNIPFITYVSQNINYGTVVGVDNLQCICLEEELRKIVISYAIRGFCIILINVDLQFKALKDRNLFGDAFNVVSQEEHVPKIERFH